ADGEQQPGIVERRMVDPWHTHVRRTVCRGDKGNVLDVLGQHVGSRLEDQDASAARRIGDEEMLGDNRAEGTAPYDDDVDVAGAIANHLCRAVLRLLQGVADKASQVVEGESREFGGQRRHDKPPLTLTNVYGS